MRRFNEITAGFLRMQPPGDRGPTVRFHFQRLRAALAEADHDGPEAIRLRRALGRLAKAAAGVGIVIEGAVDGAAA